MSFNRDHIKKISTARVGVVGDIMLDRYWFGDVSRVSPEAPVPVVHVQKHEDRLGGAANVARNVASLGARAAIMGVVGNDEAARSVRELIGEGGIADHLIEDSSVPTTIKLRVLGRQQQLIRVDFEEKPSHEVLSAALADFGRLLVDSEVLVLSDYGKGGLAHIGAMISAAREANKAVIIDPKGSDYARYRGATVLTPNRAELKEVVGAWKSEEDLQKKAEELRRDLDLDALLLTRSEEGMTLFSSNGRQDYPAQAKEVFDVSGAGDTVVATLASLMAAGLPLGEAVPWANRAGGIVVGKLGTATVNHQELFGSEIQ
ncbi:D-glycero-beta-D-manno-heptose-7-phosphate kinase [Niveibacterium terrae]|uniref:D-glycero-beta-D-manno-heptose-7-phosphate kinase n=1 Tax=Niveibacterium terrae TaxID=3373598 RepID=UPI003A935B8D